MWKIIPLAILQSAFLTCSQVFLKLAMEKVAHFEWTRHFFASLLLNWQLAVSGLCFGAASLLWIYILKTFPFSTAYPMVSLSYVMGMIAAVVVFHEDVSAMKWAGVTLIVLGCLLVAK